MTSPAPPFDRLTLEDVLEIAQAVVPDVRVCDAGLLASAVARPSATAFGQDAYPTFASQAAALMHSLARSDALVDGNKRLAWAATRGFCLMNGVDLVMTVDDAEAMVLSVAAGQMDVEVVSAVLARPLSEGGGIA